MSQQGTATTSGGFRGPLSGSSRRWPGTSPLRLPLQPVSGRTVPDVAFAPVLVDDLLILTLQSGALIGVDEATGKPRWRLPLPGPVEPREPFAGAPLVDGSSVLVRSGAEILRIDSGTGAVTSRQSAPALDLLSGVMIDSCVINHAEDGDERLEAWDIVAGKVRWSQPATFTPVPLAGQGTLVVAVDEDHVRAYDVRDGRPLWDHTEDDPAVGALAMTPDGHVVVARARRLICLEGSTGKERWRTPVSIARAETFAFTDDGDIHLLDFERYLRLSGSTGAITFERSFPVAELPRQRGSLGRLNASRTHIFACDQRGLVLAVARATGVIDWIHEETRPRAVRDVAVPATDRLYVRAFDGTLTCFQSNV